MWKLCISCRTGFSYYSSRYLFHNNYVRNQLPARRWNSKIVADSRDRSSARVTRAVCVSGIAKNEREREREREGGGGGGADGDDGDDGEAETAFLRIIYSPASTSGRSIMHPLKSTGVRNCPAKFRR